MEASTNILIKGLREKLLRITDIFEALLARPPSIEQWPEWMTRITALLAQYESALRELKPIHAKLSVVPDRLDLPDIPIEHIPNVLLRTKMSPDVEGHLTGFISEGDTTTTAATRREPGKINTSKIMAQILQETADSIRNFKKYSTVKDNDQDLVIRAVKSFYNV